jgi:predicted GTPase
VVKRLCVGFLINIGNARLTDCLQFINAASQSNALQVSELGDLGSCTQEVELSPSFQLDGHTVTLIDTPGFNNTYQSDDQVKESVSAFLKAQ